MLEFHRKSFAPLMLFTALASGALAGGGQTVPTDRADLFALRQAREENASMPAATAPASENYQAGPLTSNAAPEVGAPAAAGSSTFAADTPRAPGSSQVPEGLLRFLRNALQQSYGKSYSEATKILRGHIKTLLREGGMPPYVDATLRLAEKSSYDIDWESAWEALSTAAKAVTDNPHSFAGDRRSSWNAVLHVGLRAGYDKSYTDAVKVTRAFMKGLSARTDLAPFPNDAKALAALVHFSFDQPKYTVNWENAWTILSKGNARLRGPMEGPHHFLEVAMEAARTTSTWSCRVGTFRGMMKRGLDDGMFPQNLATFGLRELIASSFDQDKYTVGWEDAWTMLSSGARELASIQDGRGYLRMAYNASRQLSTWSCRAGTLRRLLIKGLGAKAFDRFTALSLQSTVDNSYGISWESCWEMLSTGVRQQL